MFTRILYSLGVIIVIGAIAISIIAYSRGYRPNFRQKSLTTTGILSASSYPDHASIFLDGRLASATNASISLTPGWYQVRISKEGYQAWEKRVRVQGEVVSQIDALLIPTNPSLRALTVSGVLSPLLSPSGGKVAYIIPQEEATTSATLVSKEGIWMLELRTGPLGGKSQPKQIFTPSTAYDWKNAKLYFSPDEKQLVLTTKTSALQFNLETTSSPPIDVTSSLTRQFSLWRKEKSEKENLESAILPPSLADILTSSARDLRFSPDETKILYLATESATLSAVITPPLIGSNPSAELRTIEPGKYYTYDLREDKNFFIVEQKETASPDVVTWYTDSKHIIMIEKDTISIIDYDGTNKRTVYAGHFEKSTLFPWPTGGELVILTNLNNPKNLPNLYVVDLR